MNVTATPDPQALTIETLPHAQDEVGGKTDVAADVVAAIANYAARRAPWIHALGKPRFFGFTWGAERKAIDAEVGRLEAAVDLEVVVKYGCEIRRVVSELREIIARDVDRMCGREVIEINVRVVGVHLEADKPSEPDPEPSPSRVR